MALVSLVLGVFVIASRLVLGSMGTHYKRKSDGTRLCFFCKRPLETHAHCRKCSILIHCPNKKYIDAVQTSRRLYEKRLCRVCNERQDPQKLIEDIASFLSFSTTLGSVDIPDLPFRPEA